MDRRSNRLARLRSLSGAQRKTLASALVLLPAMALALRWLGFRRTLALVQGSTPGLPDKSPCAEQVKQWEFASRMVAVASNHGFRGGTCLTKSLTLLFLMRCAGQRAMLVIGSTRDEGAFGAHAWVECGGTVLNDHPGVGRRFTPFNNLGLGQGARLGSQPPS